MYSVFYQKPATPQDITEKLNPSYNYIEDQIGHHITKAISEAMNIRRIDHGDSVQLGSYGKRCDYGASLERPDGAQIKIETTKPAPGANGFRYRLSTEDGTTGWVPCVDTEKLAQLLIKWVNNYDMEAEKQKITQQIIKAIDDAGSAEDAFKVASDNGVIYADDARDLYLNHHGVNTDGIKKSRDQREAFMTAWTEAHS